MALIRSPEFTAEFARARKRQEQLQQQLELFQSGKMYAHMNDGSGMQDTTPAYLAKTAEWLKSNTETLAFLEDLDRQMREQGI
jgi:hypothetical protein